MISRIISIFILLAVVGAGGLFYAAPIITFHDIRSAAESGDVSSLSRLIDFDRLRASLKGQLETKDSNALSAPAPSVLNDPLGAAGKVFKDVTKSLKRSVDEISSQKPVKRVKQVDIESYLTANAILGFTYGAGEKAPKFSRETFEGKPPSPEMSFFSLNHARMTLGKENPTRFTFERKGIFDWQLVHIGLPGKMTATEKAEASKAEAEKAAKQASSSAHLSPSKKSLAEQ